MRQLAEHHDVMARLPGYWTSDLPDVLVMSLRNLADLSEMLDLPAVRKQAGRALSAIELTRADPNEGRSQVTRGYLGDLLSRFEDETEDRSFLYISPKRLGLYGQPQLFGSAVASRFADMGLDIEEAGTCYAVARYTACVFHLMRVMERAVRELARSLGRDNMEIENQSWEKVSKEVKDAVKALPSSTPQEIARKAELLEAHARLDTVRTVWRNPTMHPARSYNEEQAEDILHGVKAFVRHLAGTIDG